MNNNNIFELLSKFLSQEQILKSEPMKKHTSFKIGGNADFLVLPNSISQIQEAISTCQQNNINYYVIGNGSNLLVSDDGFDGVIIKISKNFKGIEFDENNKSVISIKSGTLLSLVAKKAYENSLSGLEFASGIPGTIGGGVCMNAGAYGSELKDIITHVIVLNTKSNQIVKLSNKECNFKYRNSDILKKGLIVLEVILKLNYAEKSDISATMKEFNRQRTEKQPVNLPSAGSTFKRPLDNFAGKLIMDAGLRGYTIGGASISEKHCGFIVNDNNATCNDVLSLINLARTKVKEEFNILLEEEIRIIGKFG
ncbi:MAG: UDP-N-acetylmuramate dehydrogenase [bacterium]